MTVDAATGGILDEVGKCAEAHGVEDSSGLRRAFVPALALPNYAQCRRLIPGIPPEEIDRLRAIAVAECGEPPAEARV